VIDEIETIAIERAKTLFKADHANVQPHSGVNANMGVYAAVLQPGDTILAMNLSHGGHLSHGSKVSLTGKIYRGVSYGVNPETERLDYQVIADLAAQEKPKIIVAGGSAYPRTIDYVAFRKIADEVGAYLMVDMAHIAGLVAAGLHPSPVPHAHFVTSTTTKTLRGARGGIILCKEEFAGKIDKAIFPGIQGGPILQNVAAKALTFKLAMTKEFVRYQEGVVENARTLAETLTKAGFHLVSGGTDNHLMLVNVRRSGLTGREAEEQLAKVNIAANKNMIPFDTEKPTVAGGLRMGSAAMTGRGLGKEDFTLLGVMIARVLKEGNEATLKDVKAQVEHLCQKYPLYLDRVEASATRG
jgi:glycine hydroxymethyltransferase